MKHLRCAVLLITLAMAAPAFAAPLGLARTQSARSHDVLAGAPLVVTWVLSNEASEPLDDPLLVTTLAAGVTVDAADPPARVRGRELAVALPAIAPGSIGTVRLTLRVPAGGSLVDDGARAFASRGTRAVEAIATPTTLRALLGTDPAYLASTPDAPTEDPGVLRTIARVGCAPEALFAEVRDATTHEVYAGALRGARGVLRTSAGNALDRASLLVALLRACGVPARWAAGTLAAPQARELIASMFDGLAPRTVGGLDQATQAFAVASDLSGLLMEPLSFLPGAGTTADPTDDPLLLAQAARHHWVEHDDGGGFAALDPSFATAAPGDVFAATSATFAAVPADEHHTVRVALDSEIAPLGLGGNFLRIADTLATALGTPDERYDHVGNVLVESRTVLDATFTSVELVGRPLTLGQFVASTIIGGLGLSATRTVYAPWLQVGDDPDLVRGEDVEEFISTFSSDLLTGMFLRLTVTAPDGTATTHQRDLVDRIGYAARREGGASPVALDGAPVLTDADVTTIDVNVGGWDLGDGLARSTATGEALAALQQGLAALPAGTPSTLQTSAITTLGRRYAVAVTRYLADAQIGASHGRAVLLGRALGVRGYADSPRLTLAQARSRTLDGTPRTTLSLDLRKRDGAAIPAPGRSVEAPRFYEAARGLADAHVEGLVAASFGATAPVSFERFVDAVAASGGTFASIESTNAGDVPGLALPANARARIGSAVARGAAVLAPLAPAVVDGREVTMWMEVDPATGEMISVGEDGGHIAALEYEALGSQATSGILIGFIKGLDCNGCSLTSTGYQLALAAAQVAGGGGGAIAGGISGATAYAELLGAKLPPFNPWEMSGYLVGTAAKILIQVSGAVVKALQRTDPPLSSLVLDADVLLDAPSVAVATIAAPATFTGDGFDVAVDARHHRAGGASFYPPAVLAGLGAGGDDPALNFTPSTSQSLSDDVVALDATAGQVTLGTATVTAPANVGLVGVTGTFAAADGGATDTVRASGTFARALHLDVAPAHGAAARDRALVVTPSLRSDADDEYDLTVEAPAGWEVVVADDGTTTLLPPAGIVSGSAGVRVHARSRTEPALAAEATVVVDVEAPGTPRLLLAVEPDPTHSVPIAGTLVPLAQRITLTNLGTTADTFDLAVDGLAAGDFTLAATSPVVGAGQRAVVGLALHPGGALQPPGTPIAFTIGAAGRSGGLAADVDVTVPYPAVVGVRPRLEPLAARALPGDTLPATLVLESTGNTASTMTLAATVAGGVDLAGLPASVTLAPGEVRSIALDVAVAADAAVGRSLPLGVTADLCNGFARPACTVPDPSVRLASMGVLVGVPQTLCLLDGTIATALADLPVPAVTLQRLGLALSRLALAPDDAALRNEIIAATNATTAFLHESGLTDRANALRDLMLPVEAGDPAAIAATLDDLCTALAGLPSELETAAQRLAHGFTARLLPSNRVVAPGEDAVYQLAITSTGTKATAVDLALTGLPAGVTATLSRTQVTLAPGTTDDGVTATLRAATALPSAVGFAVHGTAAGGFDGEAPGVFAVRESVVDVAAVTPAPRLAESAGTPIAIVAVLANRANVAREVAVDLRVEDERGTVVAGLGAVTTSLGTGAATTVDLGPVDTTALADGAYTAVVTARTSGGGAIPGQQGRGTFLVGLPLQATALVEPAVVAPGDDAAVVSRVRVSGRPPRQPGTGFFDQYAQSVVAETAVTDAGAALGVPDRVRAAVGAGGTLIVDLGPDLARVTDGPGPDLVVFERDRCATPHEAAYTVAVADDPAGPFVELGTASGEREPGDEFDLLDGGVASARYVRITSAAGGIEVDAVLNAHPARPGGVQLEYHLPIGFQNGVANTPAIGDLDRDGNPEIAFNVQTNFVGCEMIVIDGVTKQEKFRLDMPGRTTAGAALCGEASGVAMGNLDDDPEGEIMVHAPTDNVSDVFVAMNADGTELFRNVLAQRGVNQSSVDLANVDDDPQPEILWPGGFRQDDASDGYDNGLFGQPIAVDLDGDGTAELVSNGGGAPFSNVTARKTDGTLVWNSPSLATGLGAKSTQRPAVGDLDGDGRPDFATWAANLLGHTQGVFAVRHDGTLLWSTPVPTGPRLCSEHPDVACTANTDCPSGTCKLFETAGSSPAIADVNGDGRPEVVYWMRDVGQGDRGSIVAFAGATGEELWRVDANDPGGIEPSLSAADLDGDGDAEVLWNGSCDGFTIVDGAAGEVVYRDPRVQSGSAHDHPAVADADADGRLEVVTGDAQGLYVFGAGAGWASGRQVWNQTSYGITNVGDDLTIPATPPQPWRFHGTFRFQGPQLADLAHAVVDVTHALADGVSFDPAAIAPPAANVAGRTVAWQAELPVTIGAAFDVPATVPALAPGETRTVSTGGSVDAELTLPDGSTVQVTIPLGPATVSAPHVIGVAPASQTTDAGAPATFLVTLTNPRPVPETFALSVLGIEPAFVALPPAATLDPGASVVLPVVVTMPVESPGGTLDFALGVTGDAGTVDDAGVQLVVNAVAPPIVPGGIRVAVVPATVTMGRGGTAVLDVLVSSGLPDATTVVLSAAADDLAAATSDLTLEVPPGGVTATRVVVDAAGAAAGDRVLAVTAAADGAPHVTDTGTATVTVSDRGVQVQLSPDAAATASDGSVVLDAVVTNTGATTDTFDLAAGGPLGAFAALGATAVTLDAGAATTVPVTLAGLDVFLQQRSFVLLTATASTDPAIAGSDASAIEVRERRGVAVRVAPASVVRVGTGDVVLDVAVENTGNACDERYVVEVTSAPAGVVGGIVPARFVVPPGQIANLRLDAASASLGSYDVQVRVTTDGANPACPPLPLATAVGTVTLAFVDDGATSTTIATSTTTSSTTTTTLAAMDAFMTYKVKPGEGAARFVAFGPLPLADRFGSATYRVVKPKQLALPADVNGAGTIDPATHLLEYQVKPERGTPSFGVRRDVETSTACGTLRLEVSKPGGLLAPASKGLVAPLPVPAEADHELDHYLCYKAKPQKKLADGTPLPKPTKGLQLDVADQFESRRYDLRKVTRFCTPVTTPGAAIRHAGRELVCWRAKPAARLIAQMGCGPAVAGDRGAAIVPKQPKHLRRDPLYVGATLGSEVLASVKEVEVCLPTEEAR